MRSCDFCDRPATMIARKKDRHNMVNVVWNCDHHLRFYSQWELEPPYQELFQQLGEASTA